MQRFEVLVNGQSVADFQRRGSDFPGFAYFPIDPKITRSGKYFEISIRCPDAISPFEAGESTDRRKLGLLVQTVELFEERLP